MMPVWIAHMTLSSSKMMLVTWRNRLRARSAAVMAAGLGLDSTSYTPAATRKATKTAWAIMSCTTAAQPRFVMIGCSTTRTSRCPVRGSVMRSVTHVTTPALASYDAYDTLTIMDARAPMGLVLWHIIGSKVVINASASAGVALAGMMTRGLRRRGGSVPAGMAPPPAVAFAGAAGADVLLLFVALVTIGGCIANGGYGARVSGVSRSANAPHVNVAALRNSDIVIARPTPSHGTYTHSDWASSRASRTFFSLSADGEMRRIAAPTRDDPRFGLVARGCPSSRPAHSCRRITCCATTHRIWSGRIKVSGVVPFANQQSGLDGPAPGGQKIAHSSLTGSLADCSSRSNGGYCCCWLWWKGIRRVEKR
mmetsp:Transcript_13103/g.40720  ORF Transcript_13103/g.40720 Transcript_13103/m.40720 type:complete len:366 (-) Transcript_13103:16-1113(-)